MSLVVIFEGQRKIVKIPSPNTLVQNVLVEAAQLFNVDHTKASLQHKRTVLESSQPFRFCGLSNNAQVDLVLGVGTVGRAAKFCKIALAVDGASNVMESLDSSLSLLDMLKLLVSSSKIPADALQRAPEVVYLRAGYRGEEALASTTLASLGLSG